MGLAKFALETSSMEKKLTPPIRLMVTTPEFYEPKAKPLKHNIATYPFTDEV
jgi:hypothetical protein